MPKPQAAPRPLIAIVGSLDDAREDYRPPLQDILRGVEACEEVGACLRATGCDLLVFSSKPKYVEAHVVRGYARSGTAGDGRIFARLPRHGAVQFDLPEGSGIQVVAERDTSGEWELAYYRSLMHADGIVLIGGGQATRIAGIVALLWQIPVLPVAAFGGGANQVWVNLDREGNDATPSEIVRMGQPWSAGSAESLVASLIAQRDRRKQRQLAERHAARRRAIGARVALIATLLALVVAWLAAPFVSSASPPGIENLLILLAVPMIASAAGALLRNVTEAERWGWATARGLAAGFVTVFIYLAGELVSVPDLVARLDAQRLLFFLAPLALTAGFAFDRVLARMLRGAMKVPHLDGSAQDD